MKTIPHKLTAILWAVLLVVIGVASITSVRWISPAVHVESSFGPTRDLSHALVLGLLILAAAALTSQGRVPPWSRFLKLALALVVGGIALSSALAADKTLAAYAGAGLLVGLSLMATTYHLADRPWKIHLAIVVLTALGVAFAAKTWIRERYEIDQTWAHYEKDKAAFWAKQGKDLDDPAVKMFERRLLGRDNGGFFFHSNLGGMYLATVFFVGLALIARRVAERRAPFGVAWLVGAVLMLAFIFSALVLTWSKGAILATILALLITGLLWRFRAPLRRHFGAAVAGTAIALALLTAAVIGYGVAKGTLPTLSMAYRWQYWTSSLAMFRDHPWAGVGLANYGHYYQRYKLPEAEEEITSPHNFIVQGFTEMGLFGGIGFLLLPLAIFYQVAAGSRSAPCRPPEHGDEAGPPAARWLLIVTLGIFGTVFLFNPSGLPGPLALLAEYLPYVIAFAVAFVVSTLQGDRFETLTNQPPSPFVVLCLTGALIAFILGDIVNFSLEEPSTQFLFFFLAGLTLAAVRGPDRGPARFTFWNLGYAAAAIAFLVLLAIPAFHAESAAVRAERSPTEANPAYDRPYQDFARLARKHPRDGHMAAQAGKRLLELARQGPPSLDLLARAADWFALAAERAPAVWQFKSQQAQCEMAMAGLDPDNALKHLEKAETLFEQARGLAPRSKNLAMALGLLYTRHTAVLPAGQTAQRARLAALARQHLAEARQLDRALKPESDRRLTERQIRDIHQALESLAP